jgi:hypothetical protein
MYEKIGACKTGISRVYGTVQFKESICTELN